MNLFMRALPALTLAMSCLVAQAELVGRSPYAAAPWGQESDANSGPAYQQTLVAPTDFVVEAIRWWGYHGTDSMGPAEDDFVVALDGVAQAGTLSIIEGANGFAEYTLDIIDIRLDATTLSITNDSFDVVWFWQSAPATGNPDAPDADAVAFELIGHIDGGSHDVPEPASWLLLLGAAIAANARKCCRYATHVVRWQVCAVPETHQRGTGARC